MKADPARLAAIAAQREALWSAGYRPLTVYSFDHPDRGRAGKAPLGGNWEKRARQEPPEVTRLPAVAHATNTGIMADGLRAIDIDVDEPELAQRLCELALERLGNTLIRRRANSGRCLLPYRAAHGAPKKRVLPGKIGKIEVLGYGQQFVAHGVHPSGAELLWTPVPPENMPIDDLPAVTEEQITAFLHSAAPLIEAEPPKSERQANGQAGPHRHNGSGNGHVHGGDILDVIAALAAIPNDQPADWEFWNSIGMAVWVSSGGSEFGFAAWCAWSATHSDYDLELCSERWGHYPGSPPDQTGAGKLYNLAAKACPGWRRPSEQRASQEREVAIELPKVEWRDVSLSQWAGRDPGPRMGPAGLSNRPRAYTGRQA